MIVLRVLRVFLIVAGILSATLGVVMIAVDAKVSGGAVMISWTCKPEGSGAAGGVQCSTNNSRYNGPDGLVGTLGWLGLPIGGVALIGAAIALGQFDRPRSAPAPTGNFMAPSGPPPPIPPGHGHHPAQGGGRPGGY